MNVQDEIHIAIRKLDVEKIEGILQANTNILYESDPRPLSYACKLGNLTSVKAILPFMSADMNDDEVFSISQDCFLYAYQLGHEQITKQLRQKFFGWSEFSSSPDPSP